MVLRKALSVTIIRKAAITLPRLRMLGHYLSVSVVAFYWLSYIVRGMSTFPNDGSVNCGWSVTDC